MRVVATFHPPSSVVQSVKCRLNPADDLEYLVVAKTTRVEVFSLQPGGLQRECGADIWGRVVSLRTIPVDDAGTANILVMTDHPDPKLIVLGYAVEGDAPSLTDQGYVSLQDRYGRHAEFVTDVFVDPSGEVAVASCYGGKLKVVQFENGTISNSFDVSMPEIFVLALCFLKTEPGTFALAILHYDHQQRLHLLARDLDIENIELSPAPSSLLPITVLSAATFPSLGPPPQLVPVPPLAVPEDIEDFTTAGHLGGVLVVGGRKVLFFEHTSQDRQDVKKGKQRRQGKRLSSANQADVAKAKAKEKDREARRVKPKASVKWPWSEITAWCGVDEEGQRFLLGDTYGRLAMLAFDATPSLILIPLGETSPATSLTYLTSQVLYLSSHMGESQLLRIHPAPFTNLDADTLPVPNDITTVPPSSLAASAKGKERAGMDVCEGRGLKDGKILSGKGTHVEVLKSYQNLAPIMDAALADLDGSGQPQIVTCSGGRNSGALKVVRTGADFQQLAVVAGVSNVTNLWPVRSRFQDTVDTHLVATTLEETYVFQFDAIDVVTRVDPSTDGFVATQPTLALANIPNRVTTNNAGRMTSSYVDSSLVVQVTSETLTLVDYDAALGLFSAVGRWEPSMQGQGWTGRTIVAADVNSSQFVLGLSGGRLALLNLAEGSKFRVAGSQDFYDAQSGPKEIAAISCAPFDRSKNFSTHFAVSFWGGNTVSILSWESAQSLLTTVCETAPLMSLPRSLLLCNFGSGRTKKEIDFQPHLLVGLAHGAVVSFSMKNNVLGDRKVFPLGTTPAALATCTVDGRSAVFASGSRAGLLYWDRQRLHYSPVMLKDMVTRGANLNASHFPSSLVLATPSALVIGGVKGFDKMQIRSIPMGLDSPRRITHHPTLKMFGVTSNRTTPSRVGDFEPTLSSFKILDDGSFDQLGQFVCEPGEEITAVAALPRRDDYRGACFCIGTVHYETAEQEPSEGRIIVFSVQNDGASATGRPTINVVGTLQVHGCVYQLVPVQGTIAAAVNTSVILCELRFSEATFSLEKLAEWNHNYFVTSLISRNNTLVVGDAISSVSVLRVVGTQLQTIARDYGPLWPVAVEMMSDGAVIGSNSDCNLFTFVLQEGESRAQHTLERDGSYHIDDVVNKFIPGGVTSAELSEGQAIEPKQLFFTSSGRIGVILEMNDEISLHMTALQRNMAKSIDGFGGTNHTQWRAPVNSRGHSDAESSFGFLDGDFLERYLTFLHPEQLLQGENEAERITLPEAQIQSILEKLQSLH